LIDIVTMYIAINCCTQFLLTDSTNRLIQQYNVNDTGEVWDMIVMLTCSLNSSYISEWTIVNVHRMYGRNKLLL